MGEGGDFGGVVEQDGDDGGVVVAVDDESQAFETEAEVARVEREALEAFFALAWNELAGDDAEGAGDLGEDGGGDGFAVDAAGVGEAELVNHGFVARDVAAVGAEGFGERAHEHVDFGGVNGEVVADAAAAGAHGADRVGFVDEEVEFVFLLERDDAGEVDDRSFHGVEAFDDDEDFLPGAVGTGLALRDDFA